MVKNTPLVSVIIPCYNQGQYIDEAVNSVLAQTFQDFEIIIVNDGSTDEFTNEKLKYYDKPKTRVIHTENQGLAAARNNGIRASRGKYILPLDADDKIDHEYIEESLKIFHSDPLVKLVYCEAEFFGAESGKWPLMAYSYQTLLAFNLIFCTAMFKRSDYDKTSGYNCNLIYGWEDWDFWLCLLDENDIVYRIPKTLFYYRRKENSMIHAMDISKQQYSYREIFFHHYEKYSKYFGSPQQMILQIQDLRSLNEHLKNENYSLEHDNLSIMKSKQYKLGKYILKPLLLLKNILNA